MIELTVKTLDSQNHKFSVQDDITVKQFKDKIAETINVPADSQRLIYCGRVLQDDKNLNEYDVNGKVIHLVQRAPPQASSANSSNGRRQQTPNSNHRRIHHHHLHYHRQPRLDGNTMYFGAMAIPADLIEEQGIRVRPPFSRTQTRLMLAQQMLNRAQDVLTRLENPDVSADMDNGNEETEITSNSSGGDSSVPSGAGGSGGGSHQSNGQANSISGSIMQAAQAATAAAIAAAVSAVQAAGLPNITIVQEPQQGLTILSPASHMVVNLSEDRIGNNQSIFHVTGSENTDSGSSEESSRGNDDQSGNESLPNTTASPPSEEPAMTEDPTRRTIEAPRSTALAEVLEVLAQTNTRLQPFLQQYQTLMQTDPAADSNGESAESMQRTFNSVSEVMHYLSHAYHAISDITCDFTQPPPRSLRSRPLVIQHSAVLQAGIPIQAQINVMGNQSASNTSSQQQSPSESTPAANSTAAAPATQASNESSNQSETAQQTSAQRPQPRPPRSQAPTGLPPVVSISPGNLEFLVELGQGGATIDSIQVVDSRRTGSSANETNTNTATGSPQQQAFGWPRPPSAELIENFMQAMAGQMMMGRGAGNSTTLTINGSSAGSNVRSRSSSAGAATHSGTTSSTTSTASSSASATAGGAQNSQARGNTATHPTTSTQTRSTSRPHVQLAPAALQGLGANSFDPFLPCNSHHLNSPRRRPRPQAAASTASAEQPAQAAASATAEAPQSEASDQNNASRLDLLFAFMNHWLGSGSRSTSTASNREDEAVPSLLSVRTTENATPSRQGRPVIPPNLSDDGLLDRLNVPMELSWLGLLNQMRVGNSQNEGATSILHQQFSTLAEFLHTGPDYTYSEGESLLIDVFMLVARNLTFENVVALGMGHSQPLDNLQPILREFILQRMLHGQFPTQERISAAIDRITEEIQPPADILEAAHIRQDVDLMASINKFCQVRLGGLIDLILTRTSPTNFGRSLMSACSTILMELAALLLHCCEDGQQGLEAMLQVALHHITRGVFPELQRWSVNSSLTQFRSYLARINVNSINVQQYIVHRESAKTESTSEKLSSSSKESTSSPVEMEVEAPFEPILPVVENGVSSSAARAANSPSEDVQMESESLSEVLLQSESWPSSLPSDWVPIIARDSIRQRRQGPQPPFSDVYLAGMPSKRRKVVSNSKHRGSVSQVISDRVRQAVEASGVGTGVSNDGSGAITGPEQLGQAAAGDQALQQAYREHVLVCLRRRIHSDPDFTPERFPNTASYLLK